MIKMWPVYLVTMYLVYPSIWFMGSGPGWPMLDNCFDGCKDTFYALLLYVNDLVPFYVREFKGCLRWTFVFAIELKFFLRSPSIRIPTL